MLDVQVDEFTLVLQTTKRPNFIEEWDYMADNIISKFIELSNLDTVLAELEDAANTETSLPMGYTKGIVAKNVPYYFAIGYNDYQINMGVCIRFSAYAWAQYRINYEKTFGEVIGIHDFLKNTSCKVLYTSRLSRIDIAIDFINESSNINPNTIYNQLTRKNQIIRNATGRKNTSNISAISNNSHVSTLYVGSKGRNINALLRIYDKKLEQEQPGNLGFRYQESIKFDRWVRFEASYKGKYAHSLSKKLFTINSNSDLKNLLVSALTDRYQFHFAKSKKPTIFTRKMLDLLNDDSFKFTLPTARDNSLLQSQHHILRGSGLFPYLFKVHRIWGDDGFSKCLKFILNEYMEYEPNDNVLLWLRRYKDLYKTQEYPFD